MYITYLGTNELYQAQKYLRSRYLDKRFNQEKPRYGFGGFGYISIPTLYIQAETKRVIPDAVGRGPKLDRRDFQLDKSCLQLLTDSSVQTSFLGGAGDYSQEP